MSYQTFDLVDKRVEVLKELVPQVRHVAVLARPQHPGEHRERQATQEVVDKLNNAAFLFSNAGSDQNGRRFPRRSRALAKVSCALLHRDRWEQLNQCPLREGLFILWHCARKLYPLLAEHKYSDGLRIITAEFLCNDGRVSFGLS
jgi:hypothetical protein